jgi:hypothetical protein
MHCLSHDFGGRRKNRIFAFRSGQPHQTSCNGNHSPTSQQIKSDCLHPGVQDLLFIIRLLPILVTLKSSPNIAVGNQGILVLSEGYGEGKENQAEW